MLSIRNLSVGYGPIEIVRGFDMDVAAGECVALIGWSGSGKTTLLKAIAGLLRAISGEIVYEGEKITGLAAHLHVTKGIGTVLEGRHLFAGMSVHDNILVGAHAISNNALVAKRIESVFELFPILRHRRNQIAGTLSGGEQQMCAIGRALMSEPRLLLIDELSLGLAPVVVSHLVETLAVIRKRGTTVVLVEQDTRLALSIADRAYVMRLGQITKAADSAALMDDLEIQRDYLWKATSS